MVKFFFFVLFFLREKQQQQLVGQDSRGLTGPGPLVPPCAKYHWIAPVARGALQILLDHRSKFCRVSFWVLNFPAERKGNLQKERRRGAASGAGVPMCSLTTVLSAVHDCALASSRRSGRSIIWPNRLSGERWERQKPALLGWYWPPLVESSLWCCNLQNWRRRNKQTKKKIT